MTRSVTLADVAAIAGVSGKTVSRVVNRDANVSERTRTRVQAAIAQTRFRPNVAARSLAGAKSFLIGSFAADCSSFYYAELYRGGAHACRAHGYHLVVEEFAWADASSPDHSIVGRYDRELADVDYAGLVLPPPICDDLRLLDRLEERGIRYVRLAPMRDPGRAPAVFADDAVGVEELARHLWDQGHRRFGVIVGPAGHAATHDRHAAFVEALAHLGGSRDMIQNEPIATQGSIVQRGYNAAVKLLDRPMRPTAIFAFNDDIAAGAIHAVRERGLSVPGDVAVAGFDDGEIARLTWPPLTTVRQPVRAMAEAAVELLLAPVAGENPERRLPVELIVRASTSTNDEGQDDGS